MKLIPTPEELRSRVPADADLSHILPDLRSLAVPVKSLLSDPRNARKHNPRNLETVRASIASYNQRKPVVVNSRTMIVTAGNGTLEVFRQAGLEYIAAVFSEDDAVTATGYGLADNRSAELAEWDDDVLGGLLRDMQAEQVDVGMLGWDSDDLKWLLKEEADAGSTPDLDDVEGDLGGEDVDGSVFWPEIRVKVPAEVLAMWGRALKDTGETLPHMQVRALVERWSENDGPDDDDFEADE